MRSTTTHIPIFFSLQTFVDPPYLNTPTVFANIQNSNIPPFQQFPFTQIQQTPQPPHFRTPKLELAMFDGSNPF